MAKTVSAIRLRVGELLSRCGEADSVLPPTAVFNEGWMLRLVLDWASHHRTSISALSFAEGSSWFSEALLPSRFRIPHLGFVLLAPSARIDEGAFAYALDQSAIQEAVRHRATGYDAEAVDWCDRWFARVARHTTVTALSWERVLTDIAAEDAGAGEQLHGSYAQCLRYNLLRARSAAASEGVIS